MDPLIGTLSRAQSLVLSLLLLLWVGGSDAGYKPPPDTSKPIQAAIISRHYLKFKPVKSSQKQQKIPEIIIQSEASPITLKFMSQSSSLKVEQEHQTGGGQEQEGSTEYDEPIVAKLTVKKPVYQEVREIIIPQRKIIQEIRPVKEIIKTIVSKKKNGAAKTTTEEPSTTEAETTTADYSPYYR